MKTNILIFIFLLCAVCLSGVQAQTPEADLALGTLRPLPPPTQSGSMPLVEAIKMRKATRSYDPAPLTEQQLADVLWAACGITHDGDRRTVGTALDYQDILVYVLDERGAWEYRPQSHDLILLIPGDHRAITASQFYVKDAAVTLLYVSDTSKLVDVEEPTLTLLGAFHAGSMSQNVSLYCASAGLGTVVRTHFSPAIVEELLELPETHRVIMTHVVGVPRSLR